MVVLESIVWKLKMNKEQKNVWGKILFLITNKKWFIIRFYYDNINISYLIFFISNI